MTVRTDQVPGEELEPSRVGRRTRATRSRLEGLAAFAAYLATSILFFGRPVLADPGGTYVGWGADPTTFMWYLRWWPYAIGHLTNPLYTHLLWAPDGVSLAGSNPLAGPSVLASPLTLAAGPVVAYNVLALLAPALSAWAAYLLCRYLTGRFWPSALAGYPFGFPTYELGRVLGHLNLGMVFLVPLFVLLVLRRLEGSIRTRPFVMLVAALVAGQFLISSEVLLTLTLFGAAALAIGLAAEAPAGRRAIASAAGRIALGYGLAAAVLAPYLVAAARSALGHPPIWDFYPRYFSADLLNLVVPTAITRLGNGAGASIAAKFSGNLSEEVAYVGLPLLAIVVAYAAVAWRTRAAKVLLGTLLVVLVASMGPVLHVAGRQTVWMPWSLASYLPLLKYALPGRFVMYAFLIAAIVTALWLARPGRFPAVRWGVAVLAVASLVPNLPLGIWQTKVDTPSFFADDTFRDYLAPGANVLIIPFGDRGTSMLWQAQTDMAFAMPEGYVNVVPPDRFAAWPILETFATGRPMADADEQLKGFLGSHEVDAVLVADLAPPGPWEELFGPLDPDPVHTGGVTLYRVPPEVRRDYRDATPPG
jgi:hypothetical protein